MIVRYFIYNLFMFSNYCECGCRLVVYWLYIGCTLVACGMVLVVRRKTVCCMLFIVVFVGCLMLCWPSFFERLIIYFRTLVICT